MTYIKLVMLIVALSIGLVACDGAATRNTGPTINFACLQDSSKTGDKAASVDAPVTATQNCDKSTTDNHSGAPAE